MYTNAYRPFKYIFESRGVPYALISKLLLRTAINIRRIDYGLQKVSKYTQLDEVKKVLEGFKNAMNFKNRYFNIFEIRNHRSENKKISLKNIIDKLIHLEVFTIERPQGKYPLFGEIHGRHNDKHWEIQLNPIIILDICMFFVHMAEQIDQYVLEYERQNKNSELEKKFLTLSGFIRGKL